MNAAWPKRGASLIALIATVAWSCGGGTSPGSTRSAPTAAAEDEPPVERWGSIEAALAGDHRSPEERARDRFRHPRATLEFFGVEPGMTVVEIWPGGGWYTAVLAPYLRNRGRLILATLDPEDPTFRGRFARELREKLGALPSVYDQVEMVILAPPDHFDLGPEGSADRVLTFRSIHNWIRWPGHTPQPFFDAMARVLAPGGILGVVQHRAPEGGDPAEWAEKGYVPESTVIALAETSGLVLDARSEVNANPDDDRDHPNGVWSLPPTLRGGETDRERFVAIGESDRMTLRFRKPGDRPYDDPSEERGRR